MTESDPLPAGEPRRSMAHSVKDGAAHAVMLGCGEAYLSAFAILLGVGELTLGILTTAPLFAGSLAQLVAVRLLDRARSRRRLVLWPVLGQALSLALVPALPLAFPDRAGEMLVAAALLYFVQGSFATPGWNSWIGELVPPSLRGAFFGRREQVRMAFQLAALALGGLTLALGRRLGTVHAAFAALFAVALFARLLSARSLARMHEPPYRPPAPEHSFTLRDFLRRTPWSNFGRFTVYVALLQGAVNLSGPFFSLFMLRDLEFSYLQFTACSSTVLLAQIVTVRAWGRLGDRYGNRALLQVTGLLVPLLPILWCLSSRFGAILVWQALGGVLWAGFSLSAVNFLFDAVTPPKRARCVAYYNLLVNGGTLAGAALGGLLAPHLPARIAVLGHDLELVSGIQVLFLLSGAARLVLALSFLPVIREVRPVESFGNVFVRFAGLAAARGARLSVFGGGGEEDGEAQAGDADAKPARDRIR